MGRAKGAIRVTAKGNHQREKASLGQASQYLMTARFLSMANNFASAGRLGVAQQK